MENNEHLNLQDLSNENLKNINGGSDLTYWLFYVIGKSASTIDEIGNKNGGHLILFG